MRRAVGVLGTILLIALSFSLYTLVNAVKAQERQLKALDVAIAKESENTRVLKADWSYLNQPERLQSLARQHLTLVPTVARQIVILANLPEKSAVSEASAASAPSVDASQLPFRESSPPPAAVVAAPVVAPKATEVVPVPKASEPKAPAVVAASKPVAPAAKPAVKPPAVKLVVSPKAPSSAKVSSSPKAPASQKPSAMVRKAAPAQGLP
jgi:hypothetical protein